MFTKPREGRAELQLQNLEEGPEHTCHISLNVGGVVPSDTGQCIVHGTVPHTPGS